MYIVMVGGGSVGYYLLKTFLDMGHEVTVIDENSDRIARINDEFGSVGVSGDEGDPRVLAEAGINRADVFLSVTGQDETNLVACQIAKGFFGVRRNIALVTNPKNHDLFRRLGVDATVCSAQIVASLIGQEVAVEDVIPLLSLEQGEIEIVEVTLPEGSPFSGRFVRELHLPTDSILISVIRQGRAVIPRGDTALRGGDKILALTRASQVQALKDLFLSLPAQDG